MKNLIILLAFIFVILAVPSFFGSLGYAQGGGTVAILPKTVTATGDDGQIIAAWNIENLNASNTPPKQESEQRGADIWLPTVLFALIPAGALLFVFSKMGFFKTKPEDDEPYHNWEHWSGVESDNMKRKYGPD